MLPAPHRLRRRRDFGVATRRGHRAGSVTVVAHLALPSPSIAEGAAAPGADPAADPAAGPGPGADPGAGRVAVSSRTARSADPAPPRVGFVVSGAVGPAVVRNQVRRRLRHLAVDHLRRLPDGALLVVRALPAAAGAPSAQLAADLARVLDRLVARHSTAGSSDASV